MCRKCFKYLGTGGAAVMVCFYLVITYYYNQSGIYYDNSEFGGRTFKETAARRESGEDTKYILLWTRRKCFECAPFNYMTEGRDLFTRRSCPKQNCYVTENRTLLGDYTNFDAVLFNGRPILRMKEDMFPVDRSPHQSYVFVQLESADRFPVCNSKFENYFNRTMTFKLDSDYPWPYIEVATVGGGAAVGPRNDMEWTPYEDMKPITDELRKKLQNKNKAAAWFVTNCATRSGREKFVKLLQEELVKYNKTVDIYGKCGTFNCPRSKAADCEKLLEDDYFFYLSFENSFDVDYATEKLLNALQHDTVPVVFGGANYSNLLPPGSYLNARELGPQKLAETMVNLMSNRTAYEDMFRWRNLYEYRDAMTSAFCSLCAGLHEGKSHTYQNFRKWWYGSTYKKRCKIKD